MNTLKSMIYAAESKKNSWMKTANNPDALKELGKTKEEALALSSYFEGKYDAYMDVVNVCNCDKK